jgi:hypothetical protein
MQSTDTYVQTYTQIYLSVYGYSGDSGQYTLRVETGVTELQSAVRGHLNQMQAAVDVDHHHSPTTTNRCR